MAVVLLEFHDDQSSCISPTWIDGPSLEKSDANKVVIGLSLLRIQWATKFWQNTWKQTKATQNWFEETTNTTLRTKTKLFKLLLLILKLRISELNFTSKSPKQDANKHFNHQPHPTHHYPPPTAASISCRDWIRCQRARYCRDNGPSAGLQGWGTWVRREKPKKNWNGSNKHDR